MARAAKPPRVTRRQIDSLVKTILSFQSKPLYPNDKSKASKMVALIKAVKTASASLQEPLVNQTAGLLISQPFVFQDALDLKFYNDHHSAAVRLKHRALVGLGLRDRALSRRLNQLTKFGTAKTFRKLLSLIAQDYIETANGYMEVVRQGVGGPIIGLHHIPSQNVEILAFAQDGLLAFQTKSGSIISKGLRQPDRSVQIMAEFGRSAELQAAAPEKLQQTPDGRISEVIHFKANSNMHRYYGVPDWLSVVAACELVGAVKQHVFDFFRNRGVPALLLFVTGGYISPEAWKEITDRLQENVGQGNAHGVNAFNVRDPETKVTAQQLSPQSTDNGTFFKDMNDSLASIILSGHGVFPILAAVTLPGKIQGANELINAVIVFQALMNGPMQQDFEEQLWETLGDPAQNGGLQVPSKPDDSDGPFELIPLTEEMAEAVQILQPVSNLARSNTPVNEQAASPGGVGGPLKQ